MPLLAIKFEGVVNRMGQWLFDKGDRLLFMGDSITDSNRLYEAMPAGWGSWGDGYVNLLNAYTTALLPEEELMVVNRGVSGNTIVDLEQRWSADALAFNADWITVMIGVNDVWRHFDGTFAQVPLVSIAEFEACYRRLLDQTLPTVKGMILLSPFMVESSLEDAMRQRVDAYRGVVEKLAEEYQLSYGNVQAKVDEFLHHQSSYVLSSDRVHPSLAGHLLIAQTWLETVGIKETNR